MIASFLGKGKVFVLGDSTTKTHEIYPPPPHPPHENYLHVRVYVLQILTCSRSTSDLQVNQVPPLNACWKLQSSAVKVGVTDT